MAKVGISSISGRRIERGLRLKKPHIWRTRKDPLSDVWEQILAPMLKADPSLMPMQLFKHLENLYPGKYGKTMRTLQRT